MDTNEIKITILGVRGSIPTSGAGMVTYGGATSSVLFETEDEAVFLDAGTGIMDAPDIGDKRISILLSHPHIDHLLGLTFFRYLMEEGRHIDIYARVIDGRGTRQQVDTYMKPPLWPCTIDDFKATVECHDLTGPISIGSVQVDMTESNHPGGGTVYKLSHSGKSFVYATDYEHDEEKLPQLIDFAKGVDLLLYDAQYTDEEYEQKRGYGHSTTTVGVRVAGECGAKQVRFVHHDPGHDDEFLSVMEKRVKRDNIAFGRAGEVIKL